MKVKKIVTSTIELELDISGATLLTRDEASELPERLKRYDKLWWLKSPGNYSCFVVCVRSGVYVNCNSEWGLITVRPALIISNFESSNLKIGDTFKFGDKEFEIISSDKAFCLSDIGQCAFRKDYKAPDANDYEKSDIKKYVDNWFEKVKELEE